MEFKPCPFCGSSECEIVAVEALLGPKDLSAVKCSDCGARGPLCDHEIAALDEWSRAPRPDLQEVREALEECREYFDQRADAEYDTSSPAPSGNEEMGLLTTVESALSKLKDLK